MGSYVRCQAQHFPGVVICVKVENKGSHVQSRFTLLFIRSPYINFQKIEKRINKSFSVYMVLGVPHGPGNLWSSAKSSDLTCKSMGIYLGV